MQMSVVEAKAHLSELIEAALAGDEVEITRHGKAVVKLEPIKSKGRKLGFFPIGIDPDQALAPLGEDFYEWMS
ncbi:MAG: type II toxin-antitoxin system prevent-host-death family antitoxin [Actinomycetia bacterium]|nr:type II toxin-antitoxin system prevent-host-death family antitoxin [Actinomycetes bacterium]